MLKRFPIQQQRNPACGFATDPPAGGEFGVTNTRAFVKSAIKRKKFCYGL